MFNLLLSTFVDKLEPIATWLTIGLIGAILIVYLLLLLTKNDAKRFIKTSSVCFLLYALVLGITLLISGIFAEFNQSALEENGLSHQVIYYVFLPILCTFIIALIGTIILCIINKHKKQLIKKFSRIFCGVLFLCVVITLVLIYVYYTRQTKDWYKYNQIALWISSALLVLGVIILSLFIDKKGNLTFDTRCLSFAGVCVSLSFVLSYVKLLDPPTGGSVTLASLFPVMLFAYIYGMKKGLLIGFLYGILQAIQEPWIVHPAQFLLDYPIAFSMVGLAGMFNNYKVLENLPQLRFSIGAIIAVIFRFISSVMAGIFAWEANLTASLLINSVILIDVSLVIIVGVILLSSKSFNMEIQKLK